MSKQYEYSVTLTESDANYRDANYQSNRRVTLILNHEITSDDLAAIESKYSSKGILGTSYVVSFFMLLKVTGDFQYHVVYKRLETSGNPQYFSIKCQLDHKVTSVTYDDDFRSFENIIRSKHFHERVYIISYQEIPEN